VTFSIVAHDTATGHLGLAVQSRAFAVGRVIHHIHPGVGAVATQASVLAAHGERTLAAMVEGAAPAEALAASLELDDERGLRQVIAIDARGSGAAHTGSQCIAAAGHHIGDGFVVAGNILTDDTVVPAMVEAAADTSHPSLTRRLLAVLTAAQAAGGDLRGRQSASMIVVGPDDTGDPLVDRMVDVRIDDHGDPIAELGRLVALAEAYHDLERAEHLLLAGVEDGDEVGLEAAVDLHLATLPRLGDDPEFVVWTAVSLVAAGRADDAAALVARLHHRLDADRWRDFASRLAAAGMVDSDVEATWWSGRIDYPGQDPLR
jgi:uncharacterized Ntn-hydrolase superfamily protein